jgi:hypothetical protein
MRVLPAQSSTPLIAARYTSLLHASSHPLDVMSGFRSSQVYDHGDEIESSQQHRYDRQLTPDETHPHQHPPASSSSRRTPSNVSSSSITPAHKRPSSSSGRRGGTPQLSAQNAPSATASSARHMRGFSSLDAAEMAKNFKVVVRIRPPLPRELDGMRASNGATMYRDIVRTEERNHAVSICENGVQSKDGSNTTTTVNADGTLTQSTNTNSGIYATHKFTFDYVYDQDAQQVDVYKNTAREAVMSTLQGYNATILAYGQTGTGQCEQQRGECVEMMIS